MRKHAADKASCNSESNKLKCGDCFNLKGNGQRKWVKLLKSFIIHLISRLVSDLIIEELTESQ
ncbi:MAG: hypothetical protein UY35_C0036G0005 [Candidatus Saccharibacteria bacterium GW2011_GWC2_48_9]|nr:MAG: hypothetical protein UY35_C0036G0005 [Candidatus Saccharibacteria bacterium GW2011_GWC2_48_9]